ncbi:MAG: DUF881 domain-containing protein [Marmoricola sp.]
MPELGAAPSPQPASPDTAAQRLLRALLRPSRGQVVVAVLLGVLMFAAVTQVRLYNTDDAYSGLRQSDLVQALNGLSAASTRAQAEIDQLRDTRDALRSSTQQRAAALDQAEKEIETLGILAGTLPARGPGIVITVNDPQDRYSVNHLLDGVEELRDAGAEAMQINHEVRVVAQTSFQDADGGITVDGRLLTAPYVLQVIGDPDTLARALDFPGGFKDDVTLDGGTTDVRKVDNLEVDVTRQPSSPTYATPAPVSGDPAPGQ